MSAPWTTPVERAYRAMRPDFRKDLDPGVLGGLTTTRVGMAAALDDPDLGPRVSVWRSQCKHSRVLNAREHRDGEPAEYEQACSPCLRDRMRAWLLDGAS